jgi:pilus assembly protein CpaF
MNSLEGVADQVRDRVRAGLAVRGPRVAEVSDLVPLVREAAAGAGRVLGEPDLLTLTARLAEEFWGLGPLEAVVRRPGVSDVLVNGPDEVWVDEGLGLRRVRCPLGSEVEVRELAVRLAASAGRRLDDASPWVDARLPSGIRLHAVLPPLSPAGTLVSLRLMRAEAFTLSELRAAGSVPPGWDVVLADLIGSRAAFLVSGGTGAGKTTLLAALLSLAAPAERMVLVEDVGELRPRHGHVVRLEARHPNVEGRGGVGLDDLVRQALRMRPDRIVVGECRGPEVRDLLAAMNTGHAGGCGTLHANAARDVPARLEALGAAAGLGGAAIRVQAIAALDAIIHVERVGTRRRVVEIAAVGSGPDGSLQLRPALIADVGDESAPGRRGPGWECLAARLGHPGG